jgi:hypothetical protein
VDKGSSRFAAALLVTPPYALIYEGNVTCLVRECLLSFGAESVVFQVAFQKFKD